MKKTLFCLSLLVVALTVSAGVLKIEMPAETLSFKPAPGLELVNAQCLVCHSVDYIVSQPPLGRTPWTGIVKKMRDKYGAQLTDEQVESVTTYLVTNYGTETNSAAVSSTNYVGVATTGEAVLAKYGCLGCHNPEVKITGPAYKDIAAKYRKDPKAEEKIAEQVRKGGSGKWGSVLMPPFPMATDAEIKVLTTWILSLK